jgi:hypothetical protein
VTIAGKAGFSVLGAGVVFSIDMALAKAKEGQDRQNDNDQAYNIDKTVHVFLRMSGPIGE